MTFIIEERKQEVKINTCTFCSNQEQIDEIEIDAQGQGYWCSSCDGYNFFSLDKDNRKFTLIIEDKSIVNSSSPSPEIRLNKRISPLRYPGGKSKLTDYIYSQVQKTNSNTIISPYAGGASVELSLLAAGVVEKVILNDLDLGIYSLFWTIQNAPYELMDRIENQIPTHDDFFKAQSDIKNGYSDCNLFDAAWSLLLVNRLAYSGIYKANPLGGKNGNLEQLLSRWNAKSLTNRIKKIHAISDRYEVLNLDACEVIEEWYWYPDSTLLIDPPYVQKGKQLYRYYYEENEHMRLNDLLESLYQGFPGADILLCYDNDPLVTNNYTLPVVKTISRVYSI